MFNSLVSTFIACSAKPKPSFVILFADDMGYSQPSAVSDRSGFAGDNGTISTPHLDKLAAEGVSFTSWYCTFSTVRLCYLFSTSHVCPALLLLVRNGGW